MTDQEPFDPAEHDPALFALWRAQATRAVPKPDALSLAAYADGRFDEDAAAPVEAALAVDPMLLDDVLAIRSITESEIGSVPMIRAAQALVSVRPGAQVIAFRPRSAERPDRVRGALAWGALAASVLVVATVGFNLGIETQQALDAQPSAAAVDLLEPADGGVFG